MSVTPTPFPPIHPGKRPSGDDRAPSVSTGAVVGRPRGPVARGFRWDSWGLKDMGSLDGEAAALVRGRRAVRAHCDAHLPFLFLGAPAHSQLLCGCRWLWVAARDAPACLVSSLCSAPRCTFSLQSLFPMYPFPSPHPSPHRVVLIDVVRVRVSLPLPPCTAWRRSSRTRAVLHGAFPDLPRRPLAPRAVRCPNVPPLPLLPPTTLLRLALNDGCYSFCRRS
jgi:hypothetical protein